MPKQWGNRMKITYKKLWKLLIDREMMKKDLLEASKISTVSIAKLGRIRMLPLMYCLKSAQLCTVIYPTLWKS